MHTQETKDRISKILSSKWQDGRETDARKYRWRVIYDNGRNEIINNIRKFCREEGISPQHFYRPIVGKDFKRIKNFRLFKEEQ